MKDQRRVVTAFWLNDVLFKKKMLPPWQALHLPIIYGENKPCNNQVKNDLSSWICKVHGTEDSLAICVVGNQILHSVCPSSRLCLSLSLSLSLSLCVWIHICIEIWFIFYLWKYHIKIKVFQMCKKYFQPLKLLPYYISSDTMTKWMRWYWNCLCSCKKCVILIFISESEDLILA